MRKKTVDQNAILKKSYKKKGFVLGHDFKTQLELKMMLWPSVILLIIFNFIPLFGLLIAFKRYDPISGISGIFTSPWNNFDNFKTVFRSFQFWPMVRNTLGINLVGSLVGIPATIIFALLLNEIISQRIKSVIQTVTYMPHFISWVIYGGLFMTLLNTDGGVVNFILTKLHIVEKPVQFLGDPSYFWGLAVGTGLLKDIGWGAILYLAAIAGVDAALYESATVDGAGRFKKMAYITIPGIMPTLMILIIFAVSGMLNNNFTQIYVFQNSLNQSASQVSKPVIAALSIFTAVGIWNDYGTSLFYTQSNNLQTLQYYILKLLQSNYAVEQLASKSEFASVAVTSLLSKAGGEGLVTARTLELSAMILSSLPMIILYPFTQKFFIKGILLGSVKE